MFLLKWVQFGNKMSMRYASEERRIFRAFEEKEGDLTIKSFWF